MRIFFYIIIALLFYSCGSNQFAKRRYTKGVYLEKRSHGKIHKPKGKRQNYQESTSKIDPNKIKKLRKSGFSEEKIEKSMIAETEPKIRQNHECISDKNLNDQEDEVIIEEFNHESAPPDLNDGEVLRKTKKADRLGLASGIMGYTALGIFLISLLVLFILWIVFYVGVISWTLSLIIFYFMFFGSMGLGLAALVTGAISYSRGANGLALAGIIIGAIFALILMIALIAILV